MRDIDINRQKGVSLLMFPDNQPHVNIGVWEKGEAARVLVSLTDSIKVLQLLEVSNALTNAGASKEELVILYLMGARYDRIMQVGDSFDLAVVAELINSCGFKRVRILDPHSDVALQTVKNANVINNRFMVEAYTIPDAVLICPDKGASRKIEEYLQWNSNFKEVVYCDKHRDLSTGKIELRLLEPERCFNRPCVIIDDICDGGGTFMAIADQIKPAHLTLIVTHGIFSKGFGILEKAFDQIMVSNSYRNQYDGHKVKTLEVNL